MNIRYAKHTYLVAVMVGGLLFSTAACNSIARYGVHNGQSIQATSTKQEGNNVSSTVANVRVNKDDRMFLDQYGRTPLREGLDMQVYKSDIVQLETYKTIKKALIKAIMKNNELTKKYDKVFCHLISKQVFVKFLEALIQEKGILVSVEDQAKYRKFPLHWAVEKGDLTLIEGLLKAKYILVREKDDQGRMPLDLVMQVIQGLDDPFSKIIKAVKCYIVLKGYCY